MKRLDKFKNSFIENGFTKEDLLFIEQEKNQFKETYFDGVSFFDDETLIVYRTLALPKILADEFVKLNKKEIREGIGEYWTLNKELAWSIWGSGHYEEETFDVMCIGHLRMKDIDWKSMLYAFNDDIYHFASESEIRGINGGNAIKVVKCELVQEIDKLKEGSNIKSKGTFKPLGSAKELGITPKIAGHDMIAKCDCGEKFSYQNSKKNIIWECPECKGMKLIKTS
jgi:hypothetical protein